MEPQNENWRMEEDLPQDEDWRCRIPFLCDYTMGDEMLIRNIVFHISSKKYSLNLKIRQAQSASAYAHYLLDPDRLDERPDRTFYAKLIEIYYRLEYIQDLMNDVKVWQIRNNSQAVNTLFWMDVVNDVVEARLFSRWRVLIRRWRARAQALICMQQRKRMMEFAMLINAKVRDVSIKNYNFPAKENHITFKILRYAFDFHTLNKKAFYMKDGGLDTLKRKLFVMEE
jgi:hypothetical protein